MSSTSENIFKKAVAEALLPEYTDALPEAPEEHIFSKKFERKMKKLISRRRKSYYPLINTGVKRTAWILGVVIVLSSITVTKVDAIGETLANFYVYILEKFSIIRSPEQEGFPETIEEVYEITYDLSDYEVVYEILDATGNTIEYAKGDVSIYFCQYTKDITINKNTEDADIETIIINGFEAMHYVDNHNFYHLIWENGDYIFTLRTNSGKKLLLDVANSIKKSE
ncbi:MAG: DUF4367 domain-containing protein [Ruminococcus sp.]|nr:DUF4367 domain-containing protein [Ruminococcus sp.]